jgi:hypothetical protein
LPEDVLCEGAVLEDDVEVRFHRQTPGNLEDEYILGGAIDGDVPSDEDASVPLVDAGGERYAVEEAATEVLTSCIIDTASGIGVGGLDVADGGRQLARSRRDEVGRSRSSRRRHEH